MTRRVQITEAAYNYCNPTDCPQPSATLAFTKGAEWTDEHPCKEEEYKKEKQQLIDEACNWLLFHDSYAIPTNVQVDRLREHVNNIKMKVEDKKKRGYRVRAHSIEEGWSLCKTLMTTGCEGVQNDSSRYNDIELGAAFRDSDYCYVGIWGMPSKPICLRIVKTHDKVGKKYLKEVGREKFMNLYGITYKKYPLPRSLQYLATKKQ